MWLNWYSTKFHHTNSVKFTYEELVKHHSIMFNVIYLVQVQEEFPYADVKYTFLIYHSEDERAILKIRRSVDGSFHPDSAVLHQIIPATGHAFEHFTFHPDQVIDISNDDIKISWKTNIKSFLQKVILTKIGQLPDTHNFRRITSTLDDIRNSHPTRMPRSQLEYPSIDLDGFCPVCDDVGDSSYTDICDDCSSLVEEIFLKYLGMRNLFKVLGEDVFRKILRYLSRL